MNIGIKTFALTVIGVAVLSAAATKFYFPNVESKTEVVEKEVVKTDVVTVVKEVVRPDGTKEVVTTTTDKSVTKSDTKTKELKLDIKPEYQLGGGIVTNFDKKPDYSVTVGKRIMGPVWAQLTYQTNGTVMVQGLIEF